tara:strand:- start:1960 stop:2913 length:954 start_codon:yes stop_codon:yes gene_type:complete
MTSIEMRWLQSIGLGKSERGAVNRDNHSRPTLLSVCSGIGGLDIACERQLKTEPLGYIEQNAYAQAVLMARMEDKTLGAAPIFSDLRAFDGRPLHGLVDWLVGGIPCQPHSLAGQQRRHTDQRDLVDEFLRLVGEMEPEICFVENVRGFIAGDGLGRLLGGLADFGFDAEWETLSASWACGAPHKRERVFVLAYRNNERCRTLRRANGWGNVGNANGSRLQRRGRPLAGRPDELPAWPPGPKGNWSAIPPQFWPATKSGFRGVVDGVRPSAQFGRFSHPEQFRTERLRSLGNACIPQQAEAALCLLMQRSLQNDLDS